MAAAESATGLRRGLAILAALEDSSSGLGVTELAGEVGCHKSQASRALDVLHEFGLVRRDPETLAYSLGPRVLSMAGRSSHSTLVSAAGPVLRALARELGERAHLSVLQGAAVLTVLSESPQRALEATGWIGETVPAHSTSAGRALLFDASPDELAALLPGAGARDLHRRIAASRERGYAVSDEEFEPGLVAAAAPVRDAKGAVVAALNVSGPKFRFGSGLDEAGRRVAQAAAELSAALGSA